MVLSVVRRVNFVSNRLFVNNVCIKEEKWYERKKNKNVLSTYCLDTKLQCIGYLPGNLPGQQYILSSAVVFSLIFAEILCIDLKIT